MDYRTVRSELDQKQAIALSSTVFEKAMGEKFLLLFGKENWKHMFIAVSEGRVVSMVNYYTTSVILPKSSIQMASIGSVCTHPDFRGQNIASKLLSMALASMKEEGIDLVVISGSGGIYSKAGASFAGNVFEYLIERDALPNNNDYTIEEVSIDSVNRLYSLYQSEPIRCERSISEFRALLKGQTHPDTDTIYPIYMIKRNHKDIGYVIGIIPNDKDELGIKEMAGDRKELYQGFHSLLSYARKKQLHFACDTHDTIIHEIKSEPSRHIHQYASFKIINFCSLMKHLYPYFEDVYTDYEVIVSEKGSQYEFRIGNECFMVQSQEELTHLVLGNPEAKKLDFMNNRLIESFMNKAFPIPFVWTHNLNYQ